MDLTGLPDVIGAATNVGKPIALGVGAGLGQREPQPLDARDLVAHLRLARHGFDHLAEDVADADTGAHCAEAAADADPQSSRQSPRRGR